MLSATMRSAFTQALREGARGQPLRSLPSRVGLIRRSFVVAPGYKSTVTVRGFATATASKKTGRTAAKPAKPATKTKAAPKAKAATTKAKKTAKAPVKKKKAAAKPKKTTTGRPKKELSPDEKQAVLKRELKKVSLINKEPKRLPSTRWMLHVSNSLKGKPSTGISDTNQKLPIIAAEFKALPLAELERMDETVEQNKAINAGNFKTWVESYSPAEISQANNARKRLKRDFNMSPTPLKLHDDRLPKRPASGPYSYFIKAKLSGSGILSKELGEAWKSLPAAEKKPYQDLALAEFTKYKQEMEKIHMA
ncbi:HMG box protein [Diaporthe helianthi]|uniref:HMG box protein n=1 Tax=Diaporthe helianthi TaxID=158607 RepID=A0A2P5I1V0_DIAHE|nr:HMG box protein [Diaporthe helianthi]